MFFIRRILAVIRSKKSAIAETLLPDAKTSYSILKLPLNMQIIKTSTCNISKASGMVKIFRKCKLINLNECTMQQKITQDNWSIIVRFVWKQHIIWELIKIVWKKFVTVSINSIGRINACLKYSTLWWHEKTLKLITKVHVQQWNDGSAKILSPVYLTWRRLSLSHNFWNFY